VNSFQDFLDKKPLYYKEIDYKRVYIAYDKLKPHIKKPKMVHIVGTNGKGSTGRIMATLLYYQGVKIGHFSSPHISKFNERIWINGKDIEDNILEKAHKRLYNILGEEISNGLSYFEYTTLLALVAMEDLEIIIFEAGLGGEFDATNIVDKELSVITPIDLDHQDFLGHSIKEIATTKLNSIQKKAIVGFQPHQKVYNIAKEIANKKEAKLYLLKDIYDKKEAKEIPFDNYLYDNALLAIESIKLLDYPYNIKDLKRVKLFGRFYSITPNIVIDVGHNTLAVEAISKALEQKYGDEKVILVYNSLDDKDYQSILKKLKKHIKRVEIIPIKTQRAIDINILKKELKKLDIDFDIFKEINKNEKYLVFGSFYVVEAFLKSQK
jgi:dihydrofolate synthase/folylpolyglutamate synthase